VSKRPEATAPESTIRNSPHLDYPSARGRWICFLAVAVSSSACLAGWAGQATAQDTDGDGLADAVEVSRLETVPFGTQQLISTDGYGTGSIFTADLDGDGDPDVLSGSHGVVAWNENRLTEPSADFGPNQVISTAIENDEAVFAADLDGDGDQDVLSVSDIDNKVAWYENRLDEASGDFGLQQVISTTARDRTSGIAADLDGDGDPDVLVTSSHSNFDPNVAWHENRLNEASGDFGPQQEITRAAPYTKAVFAADLDGDGDADVLSASSGDDKIAWYENRLNPPNRDFGPQQVITTEADSAWSVFATDLDGDGDRDVLSASYADDKVAWYENRLDEPHGDFGPQQVITTEVDSAWLVFAADLDGDGDPDVLSAAHLPGQIVWYENRLDEPGAGFGPQRAIRAASLNQSVLAADLDGDGDADVLSASGFDSMLAWHENPGTDPLDPDSDDDGLADGAEVIDLGTDPLDPDSDDDGLGDGVEVVDLGTDPLEPDSDGDGLTDGKEANFHATKPLDPDTDGDGFDDDPEVRAGSDPTQSASTPVPSQPALFQASFGMHAFGQTGPESWWRDFSPTNTSLFVAMPLGYNCRDRRPYTVYGAPADHYCGDTTLQKGHPVTGAGTLGLGWGVERPVLVPQSAFAVSGVTGYLRDYYGSYWERHTYATFANDAGTFFAGGGPAAGRGSKRHAGPGPVSWVVREGERGFGGTLALLGKFGAIKSMGYASNGYGPWAGTSSWNMIPALGRSPADPLNPHANSAVFINTQPRPHTSWTSWTTWTITKRGTGTPWTTGSVTLYAASRRHKTTLRRSGYDNRNASGSGTIQLVTPVLTHWNGPGRPHTGHIAILKIQIVPEPSALLLFAVGASALAVLRKVSRRGSS
jgi:hypothetical protein